MLHPSFCQHSNVLDLYNLGRGRKVTQTKQLVAFTTCQNFNLSCTSLLLSVSPILRGFVNFEWQEMCYGPMSGVQDVILVTALQLTPHKGSCSDRYPLIPLLFQWQTTTYNVAFIFNWHYVIKFNTLTTLIKADTIDFMKLRNQQLRHIVLLKCVSCFFGDEYWFPVRNSDVKVKWTVTVRHWLYFKLNIKRMCYPSSNYCTIILLYLAMMFKRFPPLKSVSTIT